MDAVEDSLQYFDNKLATFALSDTDTNLNSDGDDSLIETGYTSDYTECSNPATGDELRKQSSYSSSFASRSRQTWHARKQLSEEDHLADLDSDGTYNNVIIGYTVPTRSKVRTYSGQRKQREVRRQMRKEGRRNSWTDSGLSLSRSDSHPSSESSPKPRTRSKSIPVTYKANQLSKIAGEMIRLNDDKLKFSNTSTSSFISQSTTPASHHLKEKSKYRNEKHEKYITQISKEDKKEKHIKEIIRKESENNVQRSNLKLCSDIAAKKIVKKRDDIATEHQYRLLYAQKFGSAKMYVEDNTKTVGQDINSAQLFDKELTGLKSSTNKSRIKNTEDSLNSFLVGGDSYTTTERKIFHRVFQNAKQSEQKAPGNHQMPNSTPLLPSYLNYPLYKKDKTTTGGILGGLKKIQKKFAPKKKLNLPISSNFKHDIRCNSTTVLPTLRSLPVITDNTHSLLPLGKPVVKKQGIFKNMFKRTKDELQNSKVSKQQKSRIQRDKFGSIRSIPDSLRSLWSRTRALSVANLRGSSRKVNSRPSNFHRTGSVTSLFGKVHRTTSVVSLPGYRRGSLSKNRCGSTVSLAYPSNFKRCDSIRSLHPEFDATAKILQQENNVVPTRAGWRPSSRVSSYANHHDQEMCSANYSYDHELSHHDSHSYYVEYDDTYYPYEDDVPDSYCPCCNNGDGIHLGEMHCNESMIAPQPPLYMNPNVVRNIKSTSMFSLNKQSSTDLHNTGGFCHVNDAIVAPLSMHVAQERRAETRKITKTSDVTFDTFV